jgi:hypothetical protein
MIVVACLTAVIAPQVPATTTTVTVTLNSTVPKLIAPTTTSTPAPTWSDNPARRLRHQRKNRRDREDMSLWIDKNQVKVFSGE